MEIFDKYFNDKFKHLQEEPIDIKPLLKDEIMYISGDFYGIQKFIFERLSTKNAAKVLRAKSAFIELYTITLAKYICQKLDIDTSCILSANAGKFEILSPKIDLEIIESVQKIVDKYFINNFYALSGVSISAIVCKEEDFTQVTKYKDLRLKISNDVEAKKYKKFHLNLANEIMEYDLAINNETLCRVCNIRKKKDEACDICNMFIKLGKSLVANKKVVSSRKDLLIELEGFDTEIQIDEKIRSYIQKGLNDEPITFKELADESCKNLESGIKALGILKADVDSMGMFIKNSDISDSFENFNIFSKTLENFFALHIPRKMKENYPNTYTVFAGGDDLFLVSSWDVIFELARFVHEEFERFIKDKKLSISFGISVAKASTPISYLSQHTEHLLETAKEIDADKNAISAFKQTVKWKNYLSTYHKLDSVLNQIDTDDLNTSFLYRLLDLCKMSKECKSDPINNMWKSKLVYSFSRNMDKKYIQILEPLSDAIEKNPSETIMFLSEFIYKRRD